MNTFAFLQKAAMLRPDQPALVHGAESISYREFRDRALAVGGNLLALGLAPGDRVAFCLANCPRILETIYGCFAAGLIVVPINARLHAREMGYIVTNSGAKVFMHGPETQESLLENLDAFPHVQRRYCTSAVRGASDYAELLAGGARLSEHVEVDGAQPCWLFYTSGTTGRPKGAIWTHRMVRVITMNYLADVHNIQPGEGVVHAAPM